MSKNWDLVPLKNILKPVSRKEKLEDFKQYKLLGVRLDGCGAFLREIKNGSEISATTLYRVEKGDFIYSRLFASRGAFSLIDSSLDGCYVSGEFPTFQGIENKIDLQFLYYWFRLPHVLKQVESDCSGSTSLSRNRYKQEFFLKLQIPLPPLEEQKRIVEKIERLAEKIEEVRSLRLQTIKETSHLYDSFLSSIVNTSQSNWTKATVNDVIISIGAGWSPQCEKHPALKGEWGVLKTTSVQWNEFRSEENKALPKSLEPKPELCVREGDVFVTRAGPRKRVAVVCAVNTTYPYLTISDKIICLKVKPDEVDYRFLAIILRSSLSQEYLVQRKTGLADAQVNISQAILRSTPIAYPPLSEQKRIVEYLDRLQSKIEIMKKEREKALEETDALLPSILDKAFKGEL